MINKKYFFIGIGGIGMSSIAQYLHDKGNIIFGYDRENNHAAVSYTHLRAHET